MRKKMLRSVLVTTFSVVAAFGTLSGLSGTVSDAQPGSAQSSAVIQVLAVGAETPTGMDDSVWD
ncbi:hypothetical protein [Streptomyces sp. NPDC053367]|uniref:hypothetical protein n=1 Tax=unclassified Streptomyces TaxID=2593676 RepID=UPI0037D0E199